MGMTVKVALGDPRPKKWGKAVDKRPWIVVRDGQVVVRCWFKETATEWARVHGGKVGRAKPGAKVQTQVPA
jgi:hypothetical protein